eukprot:Skav213019  [mRNA]  locus=scaffold2312:208801:210147:+ [translate_table: standard]
MLCLTWLVVSHALSSLSFVEGVTWGGQRAAKQQVTERFSEQRQSLPKNTLPAGKVAQMAKSLTTRIYRAESAYGLIIILDEAVDDPIFDFFHASAAYSGLAKWKARGKRGLQQSDWEGSVVATLHARVEEMVKKGELNAQATANVLRGVAKFTSWPSIPQKLLVALAKSMPTKVQDMTEQELSNCLWACAQLKEVAPAVLEAVPAIVAQIMDKTNCLAPLAVSYSLWACAQLKDVAPAVLKLVPALAAEIPDKAKNMDPQGWSNCLWAALQLKDDAPALLAELPTIVVETSLKIHSMKPQEISNSLEALVPLQKLFPEVARLVADVDSEEDIVRSAVARLNMLLPEMEGKNLKFAVPVIVWACAKFGVHNGELMNSVARRFGSRATVSSLPDFGACALLWSYQELDTQDDYTEFQERLKSEVTRRGFSQADVQSCQLGRSDWSGAKPH